MGYRRIRPKVRRRKVAHLAAYSRQYSVKNCTIKVANEDVIKRQGSWNIPEKGFPQPKSMMKKHTEWIYDKETHVTEKIKVPSTFPTKKYIDIQKGLWKNLGKAAKMEAYVQTKLKKWEKKHPRPCKNDDLFKEEMIPIWNAEREQALERIRDFVVSIYDKLPLTGRFKTGENKFEEEKITDIKDVNGEGHKINDLDKESKLLKKAQKIVNKVHTKRTNLIAGNLRDHKRTRGRIILPKAA